MSVKKNVSLDDVLKAVEDNLLPTGSRIIDIGGTENRQVYPKAKKIIKGNVAEELGYDVPDDEAQ
jgi:hypothetical protein